jgi:16S rRNA (guanine527-N7)-methyltransferase
VSPDAILLAGLERLGLTPTVSPLARYIDEIELFNPIYKLVSYKTREELVVRHILDSLSPIAVFAREARRLADAGREEVVVVDSGSGAGLPGIPLAVALPVAVGGLPRTRFRLVERSARRAGFLRDAVALLALDDCAVVQAAIEDAPEASADIITFRAFRPLESGFVQMLQSKLTPEGVILAYKGTQAKINQERAAASIASAEVIATPTPFLDEERNIVRIVAGG